MLKARMLKVNGMCKGKDCNAGVWYSLPGSCPTEGFTNDQISGNADTQDVTKAKSAQCLKDFPGGRCDTVSGAPDCTFHSEEAGEIMLDELAGIDDYNHFWNTSYVECVRDVSAGLHDGPCLHKKEFDVDLDQGFGCSFWDAAKDRKKAAKRMQAVRDLFKKHYPHLPADLEEPACDFDMYYDGETEWPINHTGAVKPERGFSWEKAMLLRTTTTTTRPAAAGPAPTTCKEIGCGNRGTECDCNAACHKYGDCCADYSEKCEAGHSEPHEKKPNEHQQGDHGGTGDNAVLKLTEVCLKAQEECNKAGLWAKQSGFWEHPKWYSGLTAKSTVEDFKHFLAKTKRGSCDKLCHSSETDTTIFLKK